MAIAAGTITTFNLADKREDIDKKVYMVEPMDTPLLTLSREGKAKNRTPTWFVDSLRAPLTNAAIEGDIAAQAKGLPTSRARRSNFVQQFTDEFRTTDISEQVDRADHKPPSTEQRLKKRIEVKRDIEFALAQNQAPVEGTDSIAAKLAGLECFFTTNVDRGTGGANGGWNGTLHAAPTDGTLRTYTEAMTKGIIRKIYDAGDGKADVLMMGTVLKEKFDTFIGIGTLTQNVQSKDASIIVNTTVDIYRTAYGKHKAMPNRQMRGRTVVALDPSYVEYCELQPITSNDIPTNGLSLAELIKAAGTLKITNERACGVIADLQP